MPAGKTLPCQKEACAIQKCLQGTIASRLENFSLCVYNYILCHVDKSEININMALPILLAQNKTTKKIDAGW